MKSGLAIFALGVIGIAAVAATVAPPATQVPATNEADPSPPIATREAKPPAPAPQPGGMVSHSMSGGPAVIVPGPSGRGPPPIVAIPRIPGPADMTIAGDQPGEVRTIRSFPSNEACDDALPAARQRYSDAVCISTTLPPPPPEYGFLVEVDIDRNEIVTLETHPSMAECQRILRSRTPRPGMQSACTPKLH